MKSVRSPLSRVYTAISEDSDYTYHLSYLKTIPDGNTCAHQLDCVNFVQFGRCKPLCILRGYFTSSRLADVCYIAKLIPYYFPVILIIERRIQSEKQLHSVKIIVDHYFCCPHIVPEIVWVIGLTRKLPVIWPLTFSPYHCTTNYLFSSVKKLRLYKLEQAFAEEPCNCNHLV